ncbi:hypothetical protein FBU30_010365 [Linnemannia zychae]|nr:hypothetical protein FBU30_010365 [Linnemannia zychae]
MAKLRCCILYNPSINVQTLRVILGVCPQLLELKLIETYCFTDRLMSTPLASKTPIIDVIRARCPVLKRLHFSCAGDRLSSSEMKLILDDFPALEEYSIACKDSKLILMTEIRAIVNVITTLNLLDTRNGYWDSNVNLREILCTFVHLIHLRAPTAVYFREDMEVFDPYGGVHSLWINSHGAAEYDIAGDPTGKYVWVCRGLKTLHMSVGYRFSDSNVPYRALAMYGFLSRMCPQLEELHLWRNKKDFFWLRLLPSTMDMINYTQLLIRIRREIRKRSPKFKNAIKQIQATLNARELGVDISKVGLGEDLIEWMHERYGSQNLKTWPQLEQFYIEYPGYKDDAMIHVRSFVDKIRPDVDILFRYPIRDNYMTAI